VHVHTDVVDLRSPTAVPTACHCDIK